MIIITLFILFFGLKKEYYNIKEREAEVLKETEMIDNEKQI